MTNTSLPLHPEPPFIEREVIEHPLCPARLLVCADWVIAAKLIVESKDLDLDERDFIIMSIDAHESSVFSLEKLLKQITLKYHDTALASEIANCVDNILSWGHELAKYYPPAALLIRQIESRAKHRSQSENGRLSAQKRARKAEDTWRPIALKLARLARTSNPRTSQEDIASYILHHWSKHSKNSCPKFRTLLKAISSWQRDGKLEKRLTIEPAKLHILTGLQERQAQILSNNDLPSQQITEMVSERQYE